MHACQVVGCAGHKKRYQATAHRLYEEHYGKSGKRRLVRTLKELGKTPSPLLETTSLLGTRNGWKQLAKELKIRCYTRMTAPELEEAIRCVKEGRQERLAELEQQARARSEAAWAAWQAKRKP